MRDERQVPLHTFWAILRKEGRERDYLIMREQDVDAFDLLECRFWARANRLVYMAKM